MASRGDANSVSYASPQRPGSTSAITKSWLMVEPDGSSLQWLGNYEIVARLGQGGMGKVYKARHRNLKRYFALKTLRTEIDAPTESIARFYREMEAIGRIDHPHVVAATDAGPIDGIDCLVMEYLEGVDLASLLRQLNQIPVGLACAMIRQAAAGLAAITSHGLVHRDMKPSNLFLCTSGQVKILDLGLARLGVDDDFTRRGEVYGTADYIAPEVAMGRGEYGAQADVYSLGCTFYKLLTGRAPFEIEELDSFASKMSAHHSTPAPSVRTLEPSIPAEIDSLLNCMLAKEPVQRPTASQVAAELKAHVQSDTESQLSQLATEHALVAKPISGIACATPPGKSRSNTKPERQAASSTVLGFPLPTAAMIAASVLGLLVVAPLAIWAARGRLLDPPTPPQAPSVASVLVANDPARQAITPADAPTPIAANDHGIEIIDSPIEVLSWTDEGELSFWKVGDDGNSVILQSKALGMLSFGSCPMGEHVYTIEVKQLEWKSGGWGVIYSYQRHAREQKLRYERIGCVYRDNRDTFHLVRSQFRHERGSHLYYQDIIASVPVEIDRDQNYLELTWNDHELQGIRLNGEEVPGLVKATDHPPIDGTAKYGVYCSHAAAHFYVPKLDGKVLQLSKPDCLPVD